MPRKVAHETTQELNCSKCGLLMGFATRKYHYTYSNILCTQCYVAKINGLFKPQYGLIKP